MVLNAREVRKVDGRTAKFYDLALSGHRLLRIDRQRRNVIDKLGLEPGDTVIDLGCGTGANFKALVDAVGPEGRIIGVDLSAAMLDRARRRTDRNEWRNVQLVEADVRGFEIPPETSAVMAAFALEMVPEYDAVIEGIAAKLSGGRRLGLLGVKFPDRWPEWLVALGVRINRPFGVSRDYAEHRPWLSARRHMMEIEFSEMYFGGVYLCVAENP